MKIIYTTLLFALLTLSATAELPVIHIPIPLYPAYTVLVQNTNVVTSGTNTTLAAASEYSITYKTLLPIIAQDEFNAGDYDATNFPTNAVLVFMADPFSFTDSYFEVAQKVGDEYDALVEVTNIMSFTDEGGSDLYPDNVYSYVYDGATRLFRSYINDYTALFTFDDTSVGGSLFFAISYTDESTQTEKKTSKDSFTFTDTTSLGPESGTATIDGLNALIFANATKFTVKGTYPLP